MSDKTDAELVQQALDALRALEDRLEEVAPGITDDHDGVMPEPGGRWKHEDFPRVGLALLFRMMQTGGSDLEGAASAWKNYRDTMKAGRVGHREHYPRDPLRWALWQQGCAQRWRFPPPTSSTEEIEDAFNELRGRQVQHFGQGRLEAHTRQVVASAHETPERTLLIANRYFELWQSDPRKYASTTDGLGLDRAADVINADIRRWQRDPERYAGEHLTTPQVIRSFTPNADGVFVGRETLRKAKKHPESLWQQSKALGLNRRQKGKN